MDDEQLEALWDDLRDVPVTEDGEETEADWQQFPAGTLVDTIWRWFDQRHSRGVGWLMNERKRSS